MCSEAIGVELKEEVPHAENLLALLANDSGVTWPSEVSGLGTRSVEGLELAGIVGRFLGLEGVI